MENKTAKLLKKDNKSLTLFLRLKNNYIFLKLKFSQYPSIHTNYIISHCTTL